jgi:phosphonate transport system substrate-binding protein
MKQTTCRGTIFIVTLLLLLVVACQPSGPPLTFVVIPSEDASIAKVQWRPMVEYLNDGMDRKIELLVVSDYTAVVEAMRYGHADIARLSPVGYVIAIDEGADIEPIAIAVKAETGLPGYYAMLISLVDTDTSDLSTLTFGFVDVGSTSGYVAPNVYLEEIGVTPAKSLLAGSHNAVILAVKNGSVDIGAVASNRVAVALEQGVLDKDEFKIVWQSPLIPNVPIAVQSSMSQKDKDTLTQLFLDMPEDIIVAAGTNETSYVEVDDSTYDSIRAIRRYKDR